jgi:hypothetical protein
MGMPIGEWPGPCPAFQIGQDYKIGQQHQDKFENSWDGDCGHPEGNIATMGDDLCAGLDELSLKVASDQSLIGSGAAKVRRNLPRL